MSGYAPELGPDGRERPRYGEYASAEEQRSRITQPDVTWALETGVDPANAAGTQTAAVDTSVASSDVANGGFAAPRPARKVDRIVTAVLLAYGLYTVITSAPRFVDYSGFADLVLTTMGVTVTLSDPAGAQSWGVAAAAVLVVGWVAAAFWSWTRLRVNRLAWWIPLVAGVVVNVVASVLVVVPLMSDPAVLEAVIAATTP